MPIKNFQKLWEERALKDQEKLSVRADREAKIREKETELGARSTAKREAISTDELEGTPAYDNEKLAELDAQLEALEVRATEQKEHAERVAAEKKETLGIEKAKLEEEIAAKKEAAKESIKEQLPPAPSKPGGVLPGKPGATK